MGFSSLMDVFSLWMIYIDVVGFSIFLGVSVLFLDNTKKELPTAYWWNDHKFFFKIILLIDALSARTDRTYFHREARQCLLLMTFYSSINLLVCVTDEMCWLVTKSKPETKRLSVSPSKTWLIDDFLSVAVVVDKKWSTNISSSVSCQ